MNRSMNATLATALLAPSYPRSPTDDEPSLRHRMIRISYIHLGAHIAQEEIA